MGFDLNARKRGLGRDGYFRASVYQMILLRAAMLAAGVREELVYGKFLGNDGLLVTPLQSRQIAEKLTAWLEGRNLVLDLAEHHAAAKAVTGTYFRLVLAISDREQEEMARYFLKSKSRPFRINSAARKLIRQFADFCDRSGGFGVD